MFFIIKEFIKVLFRLRLPSKNQIKNKKEIELLILGYPRSGNTFLYFLLKSKTHIEISGHDHNLYYLNKIRKKELHTVVLYRDPYEAVSSLLLRSKAKQKTSSKFIEDIKLYLFIKNYCVMYETLLNLKNITFIDSLELFNSPELVLKKISSQFNLDIENTISPEELEKIKVMVKDADKKDMKSEEINEFTVARPSKQKEEYKDEYKERLKKNPLFLRSRDIYELIKAN